jgi:hypothetical protein
MSKKQHGGKRLGAGRPGRFGNQKTTRKTYSLPVTHAADIDEIFNTELDKPVYQSPKKKKQKP